MIDYNVSGGDSGMQVETCNITIGSESVSQKNLEVWYTGIYDGEIRIKMTRLTPGQERELEVVKYTYMCIICQDLTSQLTKAQGNFAGYESVDKTLYCQQCTSDNYQTYIVK